ncbi:MAG: putative penicillin-resistance DD-carboxypeptidase [Acidobacteria bacterium]|nr:putative penicillin-resistance DD-carboxypeptidase [Acidobacteriota bacterium]
MRGMKYFKEHIAVLVVALATSLAAGSFAATIERSQTRPEKASSHSGLNDAAARNAQLRNDLKWTFGNKEQHGWSIYTALIKQLINTKYDNASPKFASALSRWQAGAGLKPSGVLDEETLYAMIKVWQDQRLKDRTVAQPGQLLTAPIPDFYDPTRAEELRQVERRTYAAYKRMVAAAVADRSLGLASKGHGELAVGEKYLKIISAFRSREYQDKLRSESPASGSAGLAVNSPHFTGRALDLYVGGEPVDTRDANRALQVETRVYQWLVRNAERFGFRPYCYEPWHWEYVT